MKRTKLFVLLVAAAACLMLAGCGPKLAEPVLLLGEEDSPAPGIKYKLVIEQNQTGKTLFFNGEMKGYYLAMSENPDEGVDVQIENSGDGFKLFFEDGTTKSYIDVGPRDTKKFNIAIKDDGCVFTIDPDLKILVTENENGKAYIGTFGEHETISASAITYINADNKGKSQFPALLFKFK